MVYPLDGIFGHKKEWNTDISYNIEEAWKHIKRKKTKHEKPYIFYDSVYVTCPE